MSQVYFISGIDTDAGKSYATGYLAARLMKEGKAYIKLFHKTPGTIYSMVRHKAGHNPVVPDCRQVTEI